MVLESKGKALKPLSVPRSTGYREAAYNAIKQAILSGSLAHGLPLIEEDIATQLQVSRTPVREALAALQHEELIAARSGRGYHVRLLTREEFVTIFTANEVVEPYLARCAALLATEEQLRDIEDTLVRSRECTLNNDYAGMLRAGRGFHKTIGIASGNEPLTKFVVSNEERIDLYLLSLENGQEPKLNMSKMSPSNQEHEMIFQAIAQRDSEAAARLMIYHSQSVRERLSAFFQPKTQDALPTSETSAPAHE